mgnify:FL=1
MKYFTIEELCQSETAEKCKIDNSPTEEIIEHLTLLVDCLLDPLREAWGSPIIINSGYRCPLLNKAVGGSKTSSHMSGWSVDMRPKNGKMEEFKRFVIDFIKTRFWDQCILEKSGNVEWVHLSLYNNSGKQRMMIFSINE